jgi:hypothetical protein
MFTGLVEGMGQVLALTFLEGGARLTLDAGTLAIDARLGDSVAINGCCLTATVIEGTHLSFDLLVETMARTNLRDAKPGATNINFRVSDNRFLIRVDSTLSGWLSCDLSKIGFYASPRIFYLIRWISVAVVPSRAVFSCASRASLSQGVERPAFMG